MNKEVNVLIKTVFNIIDQISENISDLKERQEQIKIAIFSALGAIAGLYMYNKYSNLEDKEFEKVKETIKVKEQYKNKKGNPPKK